MTETSNLTSKRLVLVGGGHSHVEVLRKLAMAPAPGCRATLISRDVLAPYSGMLPGYVAGHYTYRECHIDARPLARAAGATLYHSEVDGLDLENRLVLCPDRPAVPFDVLSINIGSRPAAANVPGAAEHALPAKPVDRFIQEWQRLQREIPQTTGPYRVIVTGAGAGGVELALTMQFRLTRLLNEIGQDPTRVEFRLITDTHEILPTHSPGVRRRFTRILHERGVLLNPGERVANVTADTVTCDSGFEATYNTLIWTTQASPQPWLAESGLATDDHGFVLVDESLRSVSHPFVHAAGDIATMEKSPRPKSGVFAVRQGPYLAENLRRAVLGEAPEPFTPQQHFLSLLSTGDKSAIASKGRWSAKGAWVWKWKDYIDTKFMRKYEVDMAAPMPQPSPDNPEEMAMQCAGCGSKIGHTVLRNALGRLESVEHHGVILGLDAPDDAAVVEVPAGKLAVHTIDYFPALVDDPYLFGRIAANHSLSDVYAMGATPHTVLAMATLPHGDEAFQEDVLTDVLAGALAVLMEEHTALVGGHTIEGDALAFGLSVNGLIDREQLLRKGGLQPGDKLILTKPIGTGAIFAADMRRSAESPWIDEAVATMLVSNRNAAKILYDHAATACTDVTGFGLLGHLHEMQRAARRDVRIQLDAIPALPGALEVSARGITSSLFHHNARIESALREVGDRRTDPKFNLIFDPQTGGGLLGSVPADHAPECVDALHAAGYSTTAIIGEILDGDSDDPIVHLG